MASSSQNLRQDTPILHLRCAGDPACVFLPERDGLCAFHWRDFHGHLKDATKSVQSVPTYERKSVVFSDYVLLHGSIFPTREKAPFGRSGASLSGALEYDPATGTVKCHECGEFFLRLYRHINVVHGMAVRDYRKKHGLSQSSELSKPSEPIPMPRRPFAKRDLRKAIATRRRNKSRYHVVSVETMNLKSKCRAQILFRLAALGTRLGRTPKTAEIRAEGLSTGTLCNIFGSRRKAIEMAAMTPRRPGHRAENGLENHCRYVNREVANGSNVSDGAPA